METLVANLVGRIRRDTYEGREFIVAPLTLIVPGVLSGSKGSLLYPLEEITKNADAWNGIPLVVDHPVGQDGSPVSARSPKVLNDQGIGHIFSVATNGKLTAVGWFDIEKTRLVDNRILESLKGGKPIELSTGLFTDNEPTEGETTFNGTPYSFIARNYRPDHLAILPDSKGACSIQDGCGVLVNSEAQLAGMTGERNGHTHFATVGETSGFGFASFVDGHAHPIENFRVKRRDRHTHPLPRTALIDTGVRNAATKSEGGRPFPARDFAFVPDRNKPSTWKLRLTNIPGGSPDARIVGAAVAALGKGFRGNKVQIPSESLPAVKAKVRTAWLEANPGKSKDDLPRVLVINEGGQKMSLNDAQRKEIVDGLIANTCCWEEEDREVLNEFSDDRLTAMRDHDKKKTDERKRHEVLTNTMKKGVTDPGGNTHTWNEEKNEWEMKPKKKEPEPVTNQSKPLTEEEWMKSAPEGVREDLEFARNEKSRQKTALVERLTANVKGEQEQAALADRFMKKSLSDLQDMASILPEPKQTQTPANNWTGAATPESVVQNVEAGFAEFGLPHEYIADEPKS